MFWHKLYLETDIGWPKPEQLVVLRIHIKKINHTYHMIGYFKVPERHRKLWFYPEQGCVIDQRTLFGKGKYGRGESEVWWCPLP